MVTPGRDTEAAPPPKPSAEFQREIAERFRADIEALPHEALVELVFRLMGFESGGES